MENKDKVVVSAEQVYQALVEEFGIQNATGNIVFQLRDFGITVKQNNVVGNILEEWLAGWMESNHFANIHNTKQESPDFWLNPDDKKDGLLEVKCFTKNPNFDIANFLSYINEVRDKPYRLYSKYLLLKYRMEDDGLVVVEDCWLKNVWQICSTSKKRPIKVQEKKNVIYNIRPAVWYSKRYDFPPFDCLEDFLSAIEQTVYDYNGTRSTLAEGWCESLKNNYKAYYGKELIIPRWFDIKKKYQ